jgi:predicted DNA-binding transcriptional regulator AlpA
MPDPTLGIHKELVPHQEVPALDGAAPSRAEPIPPTGQLIRQRELFGRLAVSSATGHRMVAAGRIGPRPIRLSRGCVRYDQEEVLAWIQCRRPDGSLHDAQTWPAVWASLRKSRRK